MPGTADQTASHDPDRELLDTLVQTTFVVMGILNRLSARHDLSLTQLRMLGILRDREPKMAELADHLGLERSTVTGLVDRAAQRGLLQRQPSPDDLRAAHVTLTEQGRTLAARGANEMADDAGFLIDALTTSQRTQLLQLLRRVCAAAPPG
ncbi:MAG: transcriptional regulator, MarR family [Ilumatobacteraceae bacterium]|nr:transcriptional regulator, MarR family [Ilumatobacteraceae bacterium]